MSHNQVKVEIVPGKVAPRYEASDYTKLSLEEIKITEQGTAAGLSLVDLVLVDPDTGKKYFCMVTGRILITLSAAIQGVNQRIHGVSEP